MEAKWMHSQRAGGRREGSSTALAPLPVDRVTYMVFDRGHTEGTHDKVARPRGGCGMREARNRVVLVEAGGIEPPSAEPTPSDLHA